MNNIKNTALPREHGSWAYVLEPVLLSLLTAFSIEGLFLGIGSLFIFLAHQPIKSFFTENGTARRTAVYFILGYGITGAVFIIFFLLHSNTAARLPFFTAVLLMSVYLILDLTGHGKEFYIRFLAPFSISLTAMSIVMSAGWNWEKALMIPVIVNLRFIPTAYYIRAKLRQSGDETFVRKITPSVHILSVLAAVYLVYLDRLPVLVSAGAVILAVRAFYGLYFDKKKVIPKHLGIKEFIFGLLYLACAVTGYSLGI